MAKMSKAELEGFFSKSGKDSISEACKQPTAAPDPEDKPKDPAPKAQGGPKQAKPVTPAKPVEDKGKPAPIQPGFLVLAPKPKPGKGKGPGGGGGKKYRVLFTGDRMWDDFELIEYMMLKLRFKVGVCIEGGCRGADLLCAHGARDFGIEVEEYPADWDKYGDAAGPIRNKQMLDEGNPDYVIALHDNIAKSKGTADMIKKARKARIPTFVVSHHNFYLPPELLRDRNEKDDEDEEE